MAWELSQSDGPLLAIHFAESGTNGYLFVRTIGRGQDGAAVLIRSVDTGELAVRKFPLRDDPTEAGSYPSEPRIQRSEFLPQNEVLFMQALTQWRTGLIPRYISMEGCERYPRSLTMQYCNGGDVWTYHSRFLADGSRQQREAFLWLVLGESLRAFCLLLNGHIYVPPPVPVWTNRVPRGKFVPLPDSQPWAPIHRTDAHMCNIFLAFDADKDVPQVLLADFSRADYKQNFFWGNVTPELVELDDFMKSFMSFQPRPSLAIERKVAEIRRQMEAGTTLLQLLQGGLYDECMQNSVKLEAKLPVPMAVRTEVFPKVFDLSGGCSYVADLWSLREALEICTGSYKVLQIPKEDVSERGEVTMTRVAVLSKSELMRMTGHFDDSDESLEAVECESDLATSDMDCGVLAQEIPI